MIIKLLCIVFLLQFWGNIVTISKEFECEDLKNGSYIQRFLKWGAKYSKPKNFSVDFFLSTRKHRQELLIDLNDSNILEKCGFDPSSKTILLIHGYRSSGRKSWMIELKDKLLDAMNVNIILVDWEKGSFRKNYINSVRNTVEVTDQIFRFLQGLRPVVERLNSSQNTADWSHLYFIGHSLGAQISGQTSHLLKSKDYFWTVERITGLDPAKPCFVLEADSDFKLGKDDAEFVDVIHTQVGTARTNGFGLRENIGHVDFYVNGGIIQPQCKTQVTDYLTKGTHKEFCSHKMSYKFFTQSIAQKINNTCSFSSYSWNGTYDEAKNILNDQLNNVSCTDCPQMGLDTPNSSKRGTFLVFTSKVEPYCMRDFDPDYSKRLADSIEKLNGGVSIFSN